MGQTRVVVWVGLLLVASACMDQSAAAPKGRLVLELGGDNPSLRESLSRLGVELEPIREKAPPQPEPQAQPGPRREDPPPPDPAPPQPRFEFFTVTLQEGETLWDLAVKHLGKGARWNELLELNGWTEAQSRRLRPGTRVRVPRQ